MRIEPPQTQQTNFKGTLQDSEALLRLPYPPPPHTVVSPGAEAATVIGRLTVLTGLAPGEVAAVLMHEKYIPVLLAIRRKLLAMHQCRSRKFENWPVRQNGVSDGADERKPEVAPLRSRPEADRQPDTSVSGAFRVPLSGSLHEQLYELAGSHQMSKSAVAELILKATIEKQQLATVADELAAISTQS